MGHCRVIIHHSSIKQLKRGNPKMCIKRIYQTSWIWKWKYPKKIICKTANWILKAHTLQRVIRHGLTIISVPPPSSLHVARHEEWEGLTPGILTPGHERFLVLCPPPPRSPHTSISCPARKTRYCSQNKTDTGRTDRQMALQLYNTRSEDIN